MTYTVITYSVLVYKRKTDSVGPLFSLLFMAHTIASAKTGVACFLYSGSIGSPMTQFTGVFSQALMFGDVKLHLV